MSEPPEALGASGDPYSRAEYRRLIAWSRRIEREAPFLRSVLERAPERSVLDLGCGTGEHTAFFAREGCRAVGLDRSEAMIEAARDHEAAGEGRFVLGEALDAPAALGAEPPFGLAICLGNMLPHVLEDEDLASLLHGARDVLLPGGVLLVQLLNYTRIATGAVRHLPVNVREGDDGREIAFLRLMGPVEHGRILFFPTTLELDPGLEEPVCVRSTRRVELRAWTADDLRPRLQAAGFTAQFHGDMAGGPFVPAESTDLVVAAVRGN